MVLIKAEDFEAGWSMASGYFPADLSTSRPDNRFARFEKFLAENEVIEVANVLIKAGGHISFRDGRHRTRVLLNLGMEVIPVTMPTDSLDRFERHYLNG